MKILFFCTSTDTKNTIIADTLLRAKTIKESKYVSSLDILSLHDKELELIKKSLDRHKGKRKLAADELGISERTLYRKIKQYDL